MSEPKNPMHRSSSIVELPKVSLRGLKSALSTHDTAAGVRTTQVGVTAPDFQVLELEMTRKVDSTKTLTMASPSGGTVVISVWTSGVIGGQAALSGFAGGQ